VSQQTGSVPERNVGSVPERNATGDADWAADTADRIEAFVDSVRNKTSVPLARIARAVVYGIIVGVMGVVAFLLLLIGLLRVLDVYLPGNVWAAHLFLGVVFTVLGLLVWRQRRPKEEPVGK
jgi:hypothetical protein